jgi:chitinase domain-containing protein 1
MLLLLFLIIPAYSQEITPQSILNRYNKCENCEVKRTKYDTIGFVTPWNPIGFDFASKFWLKFTYLSPVWFDLQISSSISAPNAYNITGDANSTFIDFAVSNNITSLIVPRVLFNISDPPTYRQLLLSDNNIIKLAETLHEVVTDTIYAGLVLEFWVPGLKAINQFDDYNELRVLQIRMLNILAKYLKERNYITLFVTPHIKFKQRPDFKSKEYLEIYDNVHKFVLVTYDFSRAELGPTSPIQWVRKCVNILLEDVNVANLTINAAQQRYNYYRSKLLIGVPMYGYEFNPTNRTNSGGQGIVYDSRVVTGPDFVEILNDYNPKLTWQEPYGELKAEYIRGGQNVLLYYPVQKTVQVRTRMAARLGAGISVWELGQGLPFHYNPL